MTEEIIENITKITHSGTFIQFDDMSQFDKWHDKVCKALKYPIKYYDEAGDLVGETTNYTAPIYGNDAKIYAKYYEKDLSPELLKGQKLVAEVTIDAPID